VKKFYPELHKWMFRMVDVGGILNRIICNNEVKTTKVVKYYFCACSSIAARSDMPERPDGALFLLPLAKGALRVLRWRLSRGDKKAWDFSFCLVQDRKASVAVSAAFVENASEKYKKALEKESNFTQLEVKSIKRVIKSFKRIRFSDIVGESVSCVSTKACAENSELGQLGTILSVAPEIEKSLVLDQKYKGPAPVPYGMYGFCRDLELKGNVTFLLEPLKVRSITTCSAFEFAAGKPIQECLSKRMKEHPNLLFGRTAEVTDIENLWLRSKRYFGALGYQPDDLIFLSGDYEAATDNIDPALSKDCLTAMFRYGLLEDWFVQDVDWKVMWKVMAKVFEFSDVEGPRSTKKSWVGINVWFQSALRARGDPGKRVSEITASLWSGRKIALKKEPFCVQTFGQMMGDIKSFPVLCILNMALWDRVCESRDVGVLDRSECPLFGTKKFKKETLSPPCLVNGDDFLACAPKTYIEKWFRDAGLLGFVCSVGKTYVSRHCASINSKGFYFNRSNETFTETKLTYLNLVCRLPKDVPLNQCIDLVNKNHPDLFPILKKNNKDTIDAATHSGLFNLFLPERLGGIGCKVRPEHFKVTRLQEGVARSNLRLLSQGVNPRCELKHKLKYFLKTKEGVRILTNRGPGGLCEFEGEAAYRPTYSCSRRTRAVAKDDWCAKLSKSYVPGRKVMLIQLSEKSFRSEGSAFWDSIKKKQQVVLSEDLWEPVFREFDRPGLHTFEASDASPGFDPRVHVLQDFNVQHYDDLQFRLNLF
jgi:hypothetical protein